MKLVITVDTEEDNWGSYSPTGHTLDNIERVPVLQELFDEFDAKPTYLITYPVAVDCRASSILRSILDRGRCEIGAHCHPWNTPPFEEHMSKRNSMLCNLPSDLQYKKLKVLDSAIQEHLGIKPISFRAGRWGYSQAVAVNLDRLGYKIDTSVTPYTSWVEDHGPNFSESSPEAYKFSSDSIFRPAPTGPLLEIPATIGYLQTDFAMCTRILKSFSHRPMRYLRLTGMLSRLRLIRKVWLSPEMSDCKAMIRLARRMRWNRYDVINLFFHSPSLKAGLSPFVKSRRDELIFLDRIRYFLDYAHKAGVESITLSDCLSQHYQQFSKISH
jgi:hypothetical protein